MNADCDLSQPPPQARRLKRGADTADADEQRAKQARQATESPPRALQAQPPVDPAIDAFTPCAGHKRRREVALPERDPDGSIRKRHGSGPIDVIRQEAPSEEAADDIEDDWHEALDFWIRQGRWPRKYFDACLNMNHLLARKRSSPSLGRKRSSSASSVTPSDQRPREEKSAPYRDTRYELLLKTKGVVMGEAEQGITPQSNELCVHLLEAVQPIPHDTLFRDDLFGAACGMLQGRNEAKVIQDIAQLIVPSAESLSIRGANHLKNVTESINEGWNNSVPLTGTRPQPDYSVGFRSEAFSASQFAKLAPFIGNWLGGDQSVFMATYYMFFPLLAAEIKCGAATLDVADRQILSFSISHDHQTVRIYGYYPVMEGNEVKYHRHPIRSFDFTELNGKEKWTAYRFTKNVYDLWMPSHLARICDAIDQIPSDVDFTVAPLPETGLPQGMGSLSAAAASSQSSMAPAATHLATPQSSLLQGANDKKTKEESVDLLTLGTVDRSVTLK
ncbi:hypothetical protein BD289DRAFT_485501 [Coniella lustricola]|uniref:DUF7924 domain-containing protein n=1 Tax=Coniella lustricola TaxID=2025994 RepID=A0A2T2ZYD4_9PEZI|nr:hypothetical protein BD289DRAFT_485501 [Coniella lustricola]